MSFPTNSPFQDAPEPGVDSSSSSPQSPTSGVTALSSHAWSLDTARQVPEEETIIYKTITLRNGLYSAIKHTQTQHPRVLHKLLPGTENLKTKSHLEKKKIWGIFKTNSQNLFLRSIDCTFKWILSWMLSPHTHTSLLISWIMVIISQSIHISSCAP